MWNKNLKSFVQCEIWILEAQKCWSSYVDPPHTQEFVPLTQAKNHQPLLSHFSQRRYRDVQRLMLHNHKKGWLVPLPHAHFGKQTQLHHFAPSLQLRSHLYAGCTRNRKQPTSPSYFQCIHTDEKRIKAVANTGLECSVWHVVWVLIFW